MESLTKQISGGVLILFIFGIIGIRVHAQECPPPVVLNFDKASKKLEAHRAGFTVFVTNIEVKADQIVTIRATGELSTSDSNCNATPGGIENKENKCPGEKYLRTKPKSGLLCRINDGSKSAQWWYCGKPISRKAEIKGTLQFSINDTSQADFRGFFLIGVALDGEVNAALVAPNKTDSGLLEWSDAPHSIVPIATLVDQNILEHADEYYPRQNHISCRATEPRTCKLYQMGLAVNGVRPAPALKNKEEPASSYKPKYYAMRTNCKSNWAKLSECKLAVKCQNDAVAILNRSFKKPRLKQLGINEFIGLYEDAVWGKRDKANKRDKASKAVERLYIDYKESFRDPEFNDDLSKKITEIASALKNISLPTEEEYSKYEKDEKADLLKSILEIVWGKFGISEAVIKFDYEKKNIRNEIVEDPIIQTCIGPGVNEGFYKRADKSLTLHMANMDEIANQIVKKKKPGESIDNKYQGALIKHIDTLLHEGFHHYQHELISSLGDGTLSKADPRYFQAYIWAINWEFSMRLNLKNILKCDPLLANRGQPFEYLATEFSKALRKQWLE